MPPRKKRTPGSSVGLSVGEMTTGEPPTAVDSLASQIQTDGGAVLATYREPFAGMWTLLAALPIERVTATPFQRELSETHVQRLMKVIPKVGRFLDPIVTIHEDDGYWTPNGMHRLEAMRKLGAKTVVCLVVPEREVAFRILALNTEKAHNLKDKSLEVIRMARALSESKATTRSTERDWAFEFEEPAYLTIGICYEQRPRFAGGAYMPVLRRCDEFSDATLKQSIAARKKHAERVLELDDKVAELVNALKEAGLKSAYLKPFVIARLNPLRFIRAAKPGQKAPSADFDVTLDKMMASAKKFDATKVRPQDLAAMAGAPTPEE